MLSHETYLKLINQKFEENLNHPLVSLLSSEQLDVFKLGFLNGCHTMRNYYTPIIERLEKEVVESRAYIRELKGK